MAKKSINDKLKDIEHMIPYKFNFDFGFHNLAKETYQHKSHYYDDSPTDINYKHEGYETYAYIENLQQGFADGYMDSDKLDIFPTLELIIKYSHIIFKDGRKYIVGRSKIKITDLISLFRFLQTTKNYAIFNNLLNVMLIIIIDYAGNIEVIRSINGNYHRDIPTIINKHYRRLYKENPENNEVRLVNSFIYEIDKKEVDYYSQEFNEKARVHIASNWDKCFDELISHFQKKSSSHKPSSHSPVKEGDLTINACKSLLEKSGYIINKGQNSQSPDKETKISNNMTITLFEKLKYNMKLGHNLNMSLQYQFIINNIDDFPSKGREYNMKLIYTSNKPINEIHDVFEAINYALPPKIGKFEGTDFTAIVAHTRLEQNRQVALGEYNDKIRKGLIPFFINIYSDNNKLYITYQIGEKYKRDKTPDIPLKIMQLNQLILFSNDILLKELFNLAKKGADWLPPKGSSSSSLGSSGSPPKGGKAKNK